MPISFNEPITFGRNGTAQRLNCTGIDFSEAGERSWTCAPVAEFDVQLPVARQDIALRLEASPFVVEDLVSAQQVYIYLGGLFVGFFILRSHDIKTFPIARGVITVRPVRMSLVVPTAASPFSLDLSTDMRELGICLHSIVFTTTP